MELKAIMNVDPEIGDLIRQETIRQFQTIRLIPSENYVSRAVLEATGSVLTNKYSEGYPGHRYYEGQEFIDQIERLARKRAKALFGVEHANVQPYSGSPANFAVYFALLEPGDKVMGMALPHGGHLTHGWNVSVTGKYFTSVQYGVDPATGRIDYDQVREIALRERPKLIIAGATAYPRVIDFHAFRQIADEVGAYFLADIAHIAGLVAGNAHPSPAPYADVITTTTHKSLRGPRGAMIMSRKAVKKQIDKAVFPGLQGGPHNHTTAAIAIALTEASQPEFKDYAAQVVKNARVLAEHLAGYGFKLVSGGTDNHLILMDVTPRGTAGRAMAQALNRAGIVVNANTVPDDPRKPFDPSGIRLGTPAITSRGMKEQDMEPIARWINEVAEHVQDEDRLEAIRQQVADFTKDFPCPGILID